MPGCPSPWMSPVGTSLSELAQRGTHPLSTKEEDGEEGEQPPGHGQALTASLAPPPPDERLHQGLERPTLNQHRGAPECTEVSWETWRGDRGPGTPHRCCGTAAVEQVGVPRGERPLSIQVHHSAPQRRHHVQTDPGPAAVSAGRPPELPQPARVPVSPTPMTIPLILYRGKGTRRNTQKYEKKKIKTA